MIVLMDLDSLIYIIGWNFRPKEDDDPFIDSEENKKARVIEAVDSNVQSILLATGATRYIAAIGHPTEKCFRHDAAKFKAYKGSRKPDDPTIALWKPIIKERLIDKWGAITIGGIEADDVCSLAAECLRTLRQEFIVCTIDKDLGQIGGKFYDYKKLDFAEIEQDQARWLFYYQMICGDAGDGVAGIPKKGDKAAHKALDHLMGDELMMEQVVRSMYLEYFGETQGKHQFEENKAVLGMMTTDHLYYDPSYLVEIMAGVREVLPSGN